MSKAHLPLDDYYWHEVPRPGGTSHIAFEEYSAYIWSLERRLLRVGELGTRCLQLGDNQTQVGAHAKGRSSSVALNRYCRQDCALQVAGDLVALELWLPSKENPSDRASRIYAERHRRAAARLRAEEEYQGHDGGMLQLPRELVNHVYVFVHLFSGPRRPQDLEEWVRRLAWEEGYDCAVISYDPLVDEKCDILCNTQFSMLRKLAYTGRIDGEHGGPVCATYSRLRHLPGGPPPLRSRRRPFGLPNLSARNRELLRKGSEFCSSTDGYRGGRHTFHRAPRGSTWGLPVYLGDTAVGTPGGSGRYHDYDTPVYVWRYHTQGDRDRRQRAGTSQASSSLLPSLSFRKVSGAGSRCFLVKSYSHLPARALPPACRLAHQRLHCTLTYCYGAIWCSRRAGIFWRAGTPSDGFSEGSAGSAFA